MKNTHHVAQNSDTVRVIYMREGDAHKEEYYVICEQTALEEWRKGRQIDIYQ